MILAVFLLGLALACAGPVSMGLDLTTRNFIGIWLSVMGGVLVATSFAMVK